MEEAEGFEPSLGYVVEVIVFETTAIANSAMLPFLVGVTGIEPVLLDYRSSILPIELHSFLVWMGGLEPPYSPDKTYLIPSEGASQLAYIQ